MLAAASMFTALSNAMCKRPEQLRLLKYLHDNFSITHEDVLKIRTLILTAMNAEVAVVECNEIREPQQHNDSFDSCDSGISDNSLTDNDCSADNDIMAQAAKDNSCGELTPNDIMDICIRE